MKGKTKLVLFSVIVLIIAIFFYVLLFLTYRTFGLSHVIYLLAVIIIFLTHYFIFNSLYKKFKHKIEEGNENLLNILENIPTAILFIKDRKIIFVNEAGVKMLRGNTKEEILGRPPIDFVAEGQKEISIKRAEAFEKGVKELPIFRGKIKRLDGSYLWVETKSRLIEFNGDTIIQSMMWDITKLKETEENLLRANAQLNNIYNSSNLMIFSLDKEYRYISFNKLYEEKMKTIWNVDIKKGINVLDLIDDLTLRKKAKEKFDRVLSGEYIEEKQEFDLPLGRKYLWTTYSPLKNNEDIIVGLTVFIKDITSEITAKKEVSKLLKVIQTSPQGIAIFDETFKISYVNKKAYELGNWDSENEILGKDISFFFREEDYSKVFEKIIPKLRKGEVWSGEIIMKKKDQSTVLTELYASGVLDDKGEVESFFILFSDITEKKKIENELKEAYEFTRTVLSSIPAPVFSKDRYGRFLIVNEEFSKYVGMSPKEIRGKTTDELWPSEASEFYKKKDQELMETDGEDIYEFYLIHKDRGKVPGVFHKACFHNAEGNVAGIVGVFIDLSELKTTQRALQDSEEKSKAILDAIPDMLFIIDKDLKFITFQASNKDALLLSPEDFIGKKMDTLLPPLIVDKTRKAVEQVDKTGEISIYEYTLDINNEQNWFEARMVKKAENEFLVMVRNITKNKQLESQLVQSQKMETIGTLAGGIAHDFNNILTIINGYCEIGLRKIKNNKNIENELTFIYKATQKAIKLVSQLLAFSRKQLISPKLLDINKTIKNLYSMLKRLIPENIYLELELAEEELIISIDPSQIEQILVNLIVNAKDAILNNKNKEQERKIKITTSRERFDDDYFITHTESIKGDYVLIIVSDTGMGMSEEVKQKVFEPFFTTKPRGKGTGLGLSMVYGIVKQNSGSIYLYSEEKLGTTVKIYFPLQKKKNNLEYNSKDNTIVETEGEGENILIVEDEEEVRIFLKKALLTHNYNVIEAKNGKEAIDILEKEKIDLIITDLIMPEMNGEELYENIKERKPEMKFIFTSGYTDDHISKKNILNKEINFLNKPYSLNKLLTLIKKVIKS